MKRLLGAVVSLWRDSPNWRLGVLVASVLSVLAILPLGGGRPSAPPGSTASYQPPPASGGSAPSPINPVAPVNQSLACLALHASSPALHGTTTALRCEGLVHAMQRCGVQPSERAQATPAQTALLDELEACLPLIAMSDERWASVQSAMREHRRDGTLRTAASLVVAADRLDAFDRDRATTPARRDLLDGSAKARVARERALEAIAELVPLAQLFREPSADSMTLVRDLADGHRRIEQLDLSVSAADLEGIEKSTFEAAHRAWKAIEESDRRIAALDAAMARRTTDPLPFLIALGALDELDRSRIRARAPGAQGVADLDAAIREVMPNGLDLALESYERRPTYEDATRVERLLALARSASLEIGEPLAPRTDRVRADLAGHEKRMGHLRKVAREWTEFRHGAHADDGQRRTIENRVTKAIDLVVIPGTLELNEFDAGGLTDQNRDDFSTLARAYVEITGRHALAGQARVTARVDCSDLRDPLVTPVCDSLRESLERAGVGRAKGSEDGFFAVLLGDALIRDPGEDRSTRAIRRAITVGARLRWSYSGRTVDLGTVDAMGQSRDLAAALRAAHTKAGDEIVQRVMTHLGR